MTVGTFKRAAKRWLKQAAPEGTLRRTLLKTMRGAVRRYCPGLRSAGRPRPVGEPLDVYDSEALQAFLRHCGLRDVAVSSLRPDDGDGGTAARYVLGLLHRREDLRQRFPQALAEGMNGAFCRWLCGPGAVELGFRSLNAEQVRSVFSQRLGARPRHLYDCLPDVRETF